MESKLKVTDIPDECSFYDLVAGDNVLEIPLFQRPYMWKEAHYRTLLSDLETVADDPTSAVFLGVIVSYSRGSGPGRPPTWMIVDGQQRVTTLYLCVLAAVYTAATNGEFDWATDVMGRYLLVRPMSGLSCNTKLIPSFNDRQQFRQIWEKITKIKNLSNHSMFSFNPPKPPVPGGEPDGLMIKQFTTIARDMSKLFREGGLTSLNERTELLVTRLSVVSISLREPTVAPKIFERLNFGAEPITVADLVRNEIFARIGDDLSTAQSLFGSRWEPFIGKFKEKNFDFNKFLFPYGLIRNPNVKRNDLFLNLRALWDNLGSPDKIIDDLERYQKPYLALSEGYRIPELSDLLHLRIDRLVRLNRPSTVYPFLIPLLLNHLAGTISQDVIIEAFDVIESFLFRRAVAGIEPSGLHAVFKGLWRELLGNADATSVTSLDNKVSAKAITDAILQKATITWPSNDDFITAIETGPLYRRKVSGYAVREYEISLDDECPSDVPQIEHIAPQKAAEEWAVALGEGYDKLVHTWGNLVPISAEMNPSASDKSFENKKVTYVKSKYSSVRKLAQLEKWNEAAIKARSHEIAEWAITRWKY